MLEKNRAVMVYKDPETQKEEEGEAILLRYVRDEGNFEVWKVMFTNFSDVVVERKISKNPCYLSVAL